MNEERKCIDCDNTGYIVWIMMRGPQGVGKGIIPPGNSYPAKEVIIEACECDFGKTIFKFVD